MTSQGQQTPAWLGTLSTSEKALWAAFPLGETVDLRTGDPVLDDVAAADTWPQRRRIRAEVVTALLLGARPALPGRLAAVRLRGARIVGGVDLRNCDVAFPVSITESRIEDFTADDAGTRSIVLRGSRLDAFHMSDGRLAGVLDLRECRFVEPSAPKDRVGLENAEVSGSVLMSRVLIHGMVLCPSAVIRGTLRLGHATIDNGSGYTLNARMLTTGGELYAPELRSRGEINLTDARLGGRLVLDGATLENPDGQTLCARQMQISGELTMRRRRSRPFTSIGRITMTGARIDGTLAMQEAVLKGKSEAFHAAALSVARSFRLAGADVEGAVTIPGAVIADQMDLGGARLARAGHDVSAFSGQGISVARELRLEPYTLSDGTTRPFRSDGTVHLSGARIGGNLRMHGAQLAAPADEPALNLSGARITQGLQFKDGLTTTGELRLLGARVEGHLNLSGMTSPDAFLMLYGATIGEVYDSGADVWPKRLSLDGFTYETFAPYRPARERISLLSRQVGAYRARPYEQLADYYRRLGHDDEARTVSLARQRARRRSLPRWRRVPGYLADVLSGYGYRPSRALAWAGGLLAFGSLYFSHVRPRPLRPEEHPVFNPVLYTADQLIPLVHFGAADTWQPQGAALAIASVLTGFGWALSIAIAAAATRALSRN